VHDAYATIACPTGRSATQRRSLPGQTRVGSFRFALIRKIREFIQRRIGFQKVFDMDEVSIGCTVMVAGPAHELPIMALMADEKNRSFSAAKHALLQVTNAHLFSLA
jgi:hypothetical protein